MVVLALLSANENRLRFEFEAVEFDIVALCIDFFFVEEIGVLEVTG